MMIQRSRLCVCLFVTKTATAVANTLTHQQGAKRDGSRDDNDGDDDDEDGDDDDDDDDDDDNHDDANNDVVCCSVSPTPTQLMSQVTRTANQPFLYHP